MTRRWSVPHIVLRIVLLGAAATGLGVASPARAFAQDLLTLTLEEAVKRAEAAAPRLAENRAREAAARSSVTALRALAWPNVTATANYQRLNHIEETRLPDGQGGSRVFYADIPNVYRFRAEISGPILTWGRIEANVSAAEADVRAASGDLRAAEGDVRLDAMRAYWQLATARQLVRVLEQSLARADAYVSDVQVRVDTGFLPPNDAQSARAARARQQVYLFQARNAASLAELDLARLIGERPGTSIVTATLAGVPLPRVAELTAMTSDELVQKSIASRGETVALAARGEGLRKSAKATLAQLKPYVLGNGWVEPAKPNYRFVPPTNQWNTAWTIDVRLIWPVFDGGRSKAQAAALSSQAIAVDARRQDVENLIALDVRQQLLDIQYGRVAITASDEGIAAAYEALRVVEERFRAGVATNTDVLDAQLAVIEAELDRTRLQAGLRIAEARLLRAVGGQP